MRREECGMDSLELMHIAKAAIEDKKGEDLAIFKVAAKLGYTDYILLATGRNPRHVESIIDEVQGRLIEKRQEILGVEGREAGEWVLLDAGDIVVHVMQPTARLYYQLDHAWSDCKI